MALGSGGGASSSAVRMGGAFVEIFVKNSLTRGLADAAKTFQNFGNSIGSIGRKMAGVGIAAGAGLATVFASSVKRSAEIGALSLKFGDSAENLSALGYAAGQASLEMSELMGGFDKMPAAIVAAQDETSELGKLFKSLGLDAKAMLGMGKTDQLLAIADGLKNSGLSGDERYGAERSIFGKSGGQFTEFLSGGSGEIRKGMEEAREVGAVVAQEQADQAKRIEDAFTKAWKSVKNAVLSVGDSLLPQADNIDKIVAGITQVTTVVREWVAANREVVIGVGLAAAGLTTIGIGLAILGPAIAALSAGWGMFIGVVAVGKAIVAATMAIISAPILLIPVALAAAGAAFLMFTETGQSALKSIADTFMEIFGPTIENIKSSFAGVVSAVGRGDLKLAFQIGVGAMRVEWARLTVWMTDYWNKFKGIFLDGWRDLALAFTNIWASAVHGTASILTDFAAVAGIYTEEEANDIQRIMDEDAVREKKERITARIKQAADSVQFRAGDLGSAGEDLKAAELAQKNLLLINGFRQVFASMNGTPAEKIAGAPAGIRDQLAGIASASRGGWGGGANVGMFSEGGGVKQIVNAVKDVEKAIEALRDGYVSNPDGSLLFVGGK